MKKIFGLTIAAVLVMGLVGGGTWAYFSDPETSTGNVLTAGTLDLKTDDADGVTATLTASTMKPSDSVGPAAITLKNSGNMVASSLDIDISYVENDGASEPTDPDLATDLDADGFADKLIVNTLTYGVTDLLALVIDADADGKDMEEVAATDLTGLAGLAVDGTADFTIQVTLDSGAGNDFQNDGIDITFTFTMQQ